MTIQEIRGLLSNAKLGRAINAAAQLPEVINDTDYSTTITIFQSRYNSNKKNKMIGIIDDDDFRKEEAQLTHSLLGFLTDLSEQNDSPTPTPTPVTGPAPNPQVPAASAAGTDGITKILFLASNPSDTAKLQLTTEHSRVSARLQEALEPEKFPLKFRQAVTPSEFAEYLFLEKPDIVHFSGHGDRKAPEVQNMIRESRAGRQDTTTSAAKQEEESGIFLLDEDKRHAHFVNTTFLKRTFKSIVQRQNIPIKVVVFNACHSSQQAEAISKIVPYVVGTSWSVGDQAATAFASGFYFGIAQGMDIEGAVDFGINQALAFNEPEDRFLLYKDGVKVDW
ncbi:CHAT domain-containing protein [Lewinella sp. LCG006]|uniref:CHAT domain-containing protein n=1 Tax=Lewinella sp. LCG006 TaxID=3231911 RepID=UPI0034616216